MPRELVVNVPIYNDDCEGEDQKLSCDLSYTERDGLKF